MWFLGGSMKKVKNVKMYTLIVMVIISFVMLFFMKNIGGQNNFKASIQSMEVLLDDNQIMDMADLVVEVNEIKLIDKIKYETANVSADVYIYGLKVADCFYGAYDAGDIIYMSYGIDTLPEALTDNSSKIFLLKRNGISYGENDIYNFVSLSQGVYLERNISTQLNSKVKEVNDFEMVNYWGKVFDVQEVQQKYETK